MFFFLVLPKLIKLYKFFKENIEDFIYYYTILIYYKFYLEKCEI